jgi:ribosomal protein S18 acetylase RimI-like enzyme
MDFALRPATQDDIPFLWEMLYYAARMSEDGSTSAQAAQDDPHLKLWVNDWGRPGDRGLIAFDPGSARKLGAAWVRLLPEGFCTGYMDDDTPELAIATLPECIGQGIGSGLLTALIESVRAEVPAISLTVRDGNPARHLYERCGFVAVEAVTNRVGTGSSKMVLKFGEPALRTLR